MKKSILFIAMLLCSFAASATTHNVSSSLSWWVAGSDSPVQAGDTLLVADGEYELTSILNFAKEGLLVMAAEGAKPVIKTKGMWMVMNINATTTFEGITFDSESKSGNSDDNDMYAFKLSANATFKNCVFQDYAKACIQVDEGIVVNSLVIDDCVFDGANTTPVAIYALGSIENCTIEGTEFKNFTEYAITASDYHKGRLDNISINNSLIHDCGFSVIYLYPAANDSEKQSCSNFELKNSTIYNIGNQEQDRGVVDIRDNASIATPQTILIDHVTLYNFTTKDWYGGFMVYKSANTTISNCIVSNPDDIYSKHCNPFHAYTGAAVNNCLYYNTEISSESTATFTNCAEADPMFVDAANGDFMLYAESPAIGMGDPRWGVKAGIQPGEGKLKAAVDAAEDGATIVLGDETYEVSSSIDFDKEGLTIVAAEGTKPIIKLTGEWTSLNLSASTTFDGITIDGNGVAKYPVSSTGTNASTFVFTNCEFKNYITYAISNPYGGGTYAESIVIDKCLFHDGGAAVCFNKRGYNGNAACNSFKMTNTTIYNVTCSEWVGIIHIASNEEATDAQNEVIIDHITMYNFTPNELGGITSRFSENVSITNSIFANPTANANQYAFRVYGASEVKNTLYHNTRIEGTPTDCLNADPLFVNAAENNFDLYANSPAVGAGTDGSNLGDPRWGVSAKVLGKRINVTPEQASSLPWMIQSDESNVKAGDTIVLAAGTYELSSFELRKEGLVIMAAENAEVKIATKEGQYLKLVATTTFDGITFDGSNVADYAIRSIGTSAKNLIVRNCKFTQYARYSIYGANDTHMDSLVVDNCIFSNSGAAIYFPASALADNVPGCSYAKITNSTLFNIILNDYVAAIDIQENNAAKETGNTEVVIDHVTIYNFSSTAKSAIKVYKSGKTNITNSIVANPNAPAEGETIYSYYIYDGAKVQNSLSFNAKGQWASNAYTDTIHADPLFVDAVNNNFMLQATSPAIGAGTDGSNLGDPRWGVEEPAFITLTTDDNSAVIAANIGKTVNVKIDRSFTANDGYYTLCVPFNMPASVIGTAYSLGTITEHVSGQGININLIEVNELSAGMPYLVLPTANMSQLVVENVTILEDPVAGQGVSNEELNVQISFQGYYSAPGVTTNGTTEYYVGNNGYLYNGKVEIRGLSGLFTITDKQGEPTKVRARVVAGENEVTGVEDIITHDAPQKVIENGQLIIIRNGLKYNVQGQCL